jgi:hypothetical protein
MVKTTQSTALSGTRLLFGVLRVRLRGSAYPPPCAARSHIEGLWAGIFWTMVFFFAESKCKKGLPSVAIFDLRV